MNPWKLIPVLAGLCLGGLSLKAEVRYLGRGHTDLGVEYDATAGQWNLHVGSDWIGTEFAPEEVVLKVKPGAQTTVPAASAFQFLGAAGSKVWILPATQREDWLFLGFGGEGLPAGVFTGDKVKVALKSVSGPGEFFSYQVDGFGTPKVLFNTRDGIAAADVAEVQAGGDAHLNWAFTQPGDYTVVLEASGTLLRGGATSSSGPVSFRFSVGAGPAVLTEGHTDLALTFSVEAETWDVHVGSDLLEETYDADDVVLTVRGEAKTVVPAAANFGFLGQAGAPVWILPEAAREKLLFLGFGGEGIPDGVFTNNQVTVTLKQVTGPGEFFAYQVDALGTPRVLFNTRDGITGADLVTVQGGGDAHLNWAFTEPGTYQVQVDVSGVLIDGNRSISSGSVTYSFRVLKPVVELEREHADLRIVYAPDAGAGAGAGGLSLVVRDEDHSENYATNECILRVSESSKLTLPSGTPFGPEGSSVYILPQSQDPNLLYLGISTEGIPGGVFAGNLALRLRSVSGPGNFFLWQAASFGSLELRMNSADGITEGDQTTPVTGSHEHYNWGFSAPGVYRVTFQVTGRRLGETEDISSQPSTFIFHVLPLPIVPEPASVRVAGFTPTGELQLDLTGTPGATYTLQSASALGAGWSALSTHTLSESATRVTVSAPSTSPQRWFRLVAP